MKFSLAISTFILLVLALVKGQGYAGFGFPGAFGLGLDGPAGLRDPRQNTGPVVFPPAPPDNGQTSGVVPGASGYGFVPSNQGIKGQGYAGFGFPGAFGLGLDGPAGLRDPRQNTGPVVFPPAPPDNGQTSGVVPGASGYGFVPSNQGSGRSGGLQSFF